jgi:UDP-N-acetyl-D-galactosamine dehydrogenase
LRSREELTELDGLVLAVPHRQYVDPPLSLITDSIRDGGILIDVKSVIPPGSAPADITVWSL